MNDFIPVGKLVKELKNVIESQFSFVAVLGEVSNISTSYSGHTYFTLKDRDAQIRCALFKNQKSRLAYELKEGQQFIVWGRVSLYEPRSDLSIVVSVIMPFGEGEAALKLKMLKEKLQKEGLFEERYKKSLPAICEHVGVVTAKGGAAVHDIIRVARERFPSLKITLYPALVQGEGAAQTIVRGVEALSEISSIDAIIVGRGGGSKEDLAAFNSEELARVVVSSKKPIVAAVGHETDRTILDLAASYTVATPSAAAQLVTREAREINEYILGLVTGMGDDVTGKIRDIYRRLDLAVASLKSPREKIREWNHKLYRLESEMTRIIERRLASEREKFSLLETELKALDPHLPLERGYTMIRQDGHLVKRKTNFKKDDPFTIIFHDGETTVESEKS